MPDRNIEIIVSDWNSSDRLLKNWLPQMLGKIPHKIVNINKEGFSRGYGLNIAFDNSSGDKIFFLDTDMLIRSSDVFHAGFAVLKKNKVFFPICRSFSGPKHGGSYWRPSGFGNVLINRPQFEALRWQEKFSWGGEDADLFKRSKNQFGAVRSEVKGFVHQWHPSNTEWDIYISPK